MLVPVQESAPTGFAAAARSRTLKATFLHLLDRCGSQNIFVSASKNAHNFAPKVFAKRPERDGFTRQDFEVALNVLLADGRITNERPLNPRRCVLDLFQEADLAGACFVFATSNATNAPLYSVMVRPRA